MWAYTSPDICPLSSLLVLNQNKNLLISLFTAFKVLYFCYASDFGSSKKEKLQLLCSGPCNVLSPLPLNLSIMNIIVQLASWTSVNVNYSGGL